MVLTVSFEQNDLDHAEAVDHRYCHLVSALLTIRECGLGQLKSDFWSQRFVAHERFLRAYLPGAQDSISGQCAHNKSKDHDELSFAFRAVRLQAIIIADDKAIVLYATIFVRHDFGHT